MQKAALKDAAEARGGAENTIPHVDHCPNAVLCRRWSADDGGLYCRRCWRDFTDPKPLQVTEGRA